MGKPRQKEGEEAGDQQRFQGQPDSRGLKTDCESQSYILSFNYYALEIHETKMPLICKPLAQGQIVPEMLEAVVYGR